jgi:peptidoglycan hydrolase FlgJ
MVNSVLPPRDVAQTKGATSMPGDAGERQQRQLRKACADFEAIFVYTMLKTMRATIPRSGFVDTFAGKDTYTMILDQKVAEELSRRGSGIGLQKLLLQQLSPVIRNGYREETVAVPESKS